MRVAIIALMILVFSSLSFAMELTIGDVQGGSEEIVAFTKIDEGEHFSFNVVKSVPPYPEVVRIWNAPPGSLFSTNGEFSWTPGSNQSGMYTVSFSITDDGTGQPVYITTRIVVADTYFTIKENKLFEYLFTATDPDGDNVEITVEGLPSGATFTGGQFTPKLFSWRPTRQQKGDHQMTIIASDAPVAGVSKQDISVIHIKVGKLTRAEAEFDHNTDDQIDMGDFSYYAKHWMAGVPLPDPPDPPDPNTVVYTTEFGTKYHREDCSYLAGSLNVEDVTIADAKADGLTACTRCRPDDTIFGSYIKMTDAQKTWIEEHDGMTPDEVLREALEALGNLKLAPPVSLKELSEISVSEWMCESLE